MDNNLLNTTCSLSLSERVRLNIDHSFWGRIQTARETEDCSKDNETAQLLGMTGDGEFSFWSVVWQFVFASLLLKGSKQPWWKVHAIHTPSLMTPVSIITFPSPFSFRQLEYLHESQRMKIIPKNEKILPEKEFILKGKERGRGLSRNWMYFSSLHTEQNLKYCYEDGPNIWSLMNRVCAS